jgi:dienelactone hydrolase
MSKISFVSDGYKLSGNLFTANKPRNIVFLLIQGWTGHQNTKTAELLASQGYTSMTYDMRGNGESEGNLAEFSRADFIKDAKIAYDYLKLQAGTNSRVGVIGSSFGSYTAVLLSEKRDIFCLSLRVPANYPDEDFDEPQEPQRQKSVDFKEWREKKMEYSKNKTLTAVHNFGGPVQIIEAGSDETVPRQVLKNYAEAVPDKTKLTYEIMMGAPHRLENDTLQGEYETLLLNWIEKIQK